MPATLEVGTVFYIYHTSFLVLRLLLQKASKYPSVFTAARHRRGFIFIPLILEYLRTVHARQFNINTLPINSTYYSELCLITCLIIVTRFFVVPQGAQLSLLPLLICNEQNQSKIKMSLKFSAAHSSRITKRSKNPLLKRSSSSPFKSLPRRKPIQSSRSAQEKLDDDDDLFEDRLDEKYLVHCLNTDLSLRDVPQSMRHIHAHMFDPIPEHGGLNSTWIAEILNFRKSLPPTVTLAHVHALIGSPTTTEREIAELTKAGVIRKLVIPGRGGGASSISDGIILSQDLEKLLKEADGLDEEVKGMQ